MKFVYISALRHEGADYKERLKNLDEYCQIAAGLGVVPLVGYSPPAMHLPDTIPIQNTRIECLKKCNEVWQMGCIANDEMQADADIAEKLGIPVYSILYPHDPDNYPVSADSRPLLGYNSCIDGSMAADYKPGDILVCRHDHLNPGNRTPLNQLWYVTHGNGCKVARIGRSIFCEHIKDGDTLAFYREDVCGIVKPEVLSAVLADYNLDLQPASVPGQDDEEHGL